MPHPMRHANKFPNEYANACIYMYKHTYGGRVKITHIHTNTHPFNFREFSVPVENSEEYTPKFLLLLNIEIKDNYSMR